MQAALQASDNLMWGPAPYGGPTHREILDVVTPREYRAPAMDLGAALRWLTEKARNRAR